MNETVSLTSLSSNEGYVFGRRSCEFSTRPAFCISKGSVHLKQLEKCLIDFKEKLLQNDCELKEQTEAKLLKYNERKVTAKTVQLEPIRSGTALEVFQDELSANAVFQDDGVGKEIVVRKEQLLQVPHNQIQILNNVKYLLTRLDEACVKSKELLIKEKERTTTLHDKIDWHAYKRIHDLPVAVQEEHEKCAYNIQELKWHCAYQGRTETRLREKVRVAEKINKRILEEIEFVKESSPLISEKQMQEKESMTIIQSKQSKTDAELREARGKLDEIERNFEQARREADQEEKFLAERLLSLSNELKTTQEKFLESQKIHSEMVDNIARIQIKLYDGESKDQELYEKLSKIKQTEKNLEREVKSLESRIFEETNDHEKLVDKNEELDQVKAGQEQNLDKMRQDYDMLIQGKTKELQRILRANKTSQKEIANLRRRIEASEKQKLADIKAVKRAMEEREKVTAELEVIKEETEENRGVHNKLLVTLEQEREKSIEVEDNLTMQVEALKKSNKEENYARMILQARINAESADLIKRKDEAERKKEKLLKAKKDVDLVVTAVNAQVNKLEEKYKERIQALEALNKLIDQLAEKHQLMESNWEEKIGELGPKEASLNESLDELSSKEKEMETTSTSLNKKLADKASSSIMMNKLLLANQNAISELNEEIAELQIQLDSGQGLEMTLRQSLKKVKDRSSDRAKKCTSQRENRSETLSQLKEQVGLALQENRELAAVYVDLQNKHIDQKNKFLSTFEKSLIAQDSLADKQNLCELHSRLHEALLCYYQLRGIQTKAGLSRFEQMTRTSNRKLENVQKSLEVATSNISSFMNANNASHKLLRQITKPPVKFTA